MAEKISKEVILSTKAKTEGAMTSLNALTNVISHVTSSMMHLASMNLQIMQSNIAVRNSIWGIVDAERAHVRIGLQRLELDAAQAALSLKLAERQLNITRRTGRYLDVQQASLSVEKARASVATTNHDIDTARIEDKRRLITADEQHTIAMKQQELMMMGLVIQTMSMITQTGILIALIWAQTAALATKHIVATLGVGAAAVGAAYLIAKKITSSNTPDLPSAQTGVGEVKLISREGAVNMHRGEVVGRPETFNSGNNTFMFNVQGNMTRDTADYTKGQFENSLLKLGTVRQRSAT